MITGSAGITGSAHIGVCVGVAGGITNGATVGGDVHGIGEGIAFTGGLVGAGIGGIAETIVVGVRLSFSSTEMMNSASASTTMW
ncbi:MAG: hypothetical protein IPO90_11540 [Flavobacteriales bacterium]|nr:hypothetical protein [Flavobacteriales bacterium]